MYTRLPLRGKARYTFLALLILGILSLICRYYLESGKQSTNLSTTDRPPSIFVAANLRNNARILRNWIKQVELLVKWAGPSRVFVSIYENGSRDETKAILKEWEEQLSKKNIAHRIVTEDASSIKGVRRIPRLANIRNKALEPFEPGKYDRLLFLNDISFRVEDAIELINTNQGDYDAACGMDFFGQFYDVFATREVDGGWVGSGDYPYFADEASRDLLVAGKPVPVYSCWNGMVVFRTEPFEKQQEEKLAFRAILPDEPDPPMEASECCLIFTDLRRLKHDTRVYINPQVKVAYDHFHYWYASYILPLWKPYLSWSNHPIRPSMDESWLNSTNQAISMGTDPGDRYCLWPIGK
ncbi:hypothetical protein VTP01DRAFT_2879 [Rhizomucor pusillus]|uniref:uncharacterized protein n=1 Tax=Rhizomucor pusillus TaxID=4840 RepID=UPI003743CA45